MTESYTVLDVCEIPTRRAGCTRYEIILQAVAPDVADTIVSTLNAERAEICRQARDRHARVAIGYKTTPFGNEAITVLLEAKV